MEKIYSKKNFLLFYYWTCISIPLIIFTKIFNYSTASKHKGVDAIEETGSVVIQCIPTFIMTLVSFFIATGITSWHKNTERNTLKKIVFVNLTILLIFSAYILVF